MNVLCGFGIGLSIVLLICGLFGIAFLIISCIGFSLSKDNNNNQTTHESSIVETIETTLH